MRHFTEPTIEVKKYEAQDVITTSNDDWSGGEF